MSEAFELTRDSDVVLSVGLPDWTTQGACFTGGLGELLEDHFPENDSMDMATEKVNGAKYRCVPCPVRSECLGWALDHEHGMALTGDGIFAGLTPSQRNFAAQAEDPIAFGLQILDTEISLGIVTTHVSRWKEPNVTASSSTGQ